MKKKKGFPLINYFILFESYDVDVFSILTLNLIIKKIEFIIYIKNIYNTI